MEREAGGYRQTQIKRVERERERERE